jgi:hypothetical protein
LCGDAARFDVRTSGGAWANFCVGCAAQARECKVWDGSLGTGLGQVLVLNDHPGVEAEVMRALRRRVSTGHIAHNM